MSLRVAFVTGATACGKSDMALRLAEESGAVLVNCDSVQVYEGLLIGSGSPTKEEKSRARHELYNCVAAPQEMTAGLFREEFFSLMKRLPANSKVLVVGGTGFYFQAIEKGMFSVPDVPVEIQEQVRREAVADLPALYAELESGDPESAKVLHPSDSYRITRAVELLRQGAIPSELKKSFKPEPFPYPLLKTGVWRDRDELRGRIRRRAEKMIAGGIIDETRAHLDRGLAGWGPLGSVGYKETVRFLGESLSKEWLLEEICLRTGQLAKRQETWFKRDRDIKGFLGDEGFPAFRDTCLRFFEGADTLESP